MPAATTAKPHELIPAMLRDWGDIGAQVLVDRLQIAPDQAAEVAAEIALTISDEYACLLYTSPSPRDRTRSRMPSSA